MSFTSQVIKSRNHLIQIVRGKFEGEAAWWIIKVDAKKFELFKMKLASGQHSLDEFGEVLAKGWGETAPENIVKEIEEKYS